MSLSSNQLKIVMGIVMVAVAFIIFPLILEGADEVRTAGNITEYTGLSSVVSVGPTVVFVSMLFGGGVALVSGIRGMRAD